MNISDCIDNENIGGLKNSELKATTLEEMQLIDSIARLLYNTKSIKKAISKIDALSKHKKLTVQDLDHSTFPLLP